MTPEEVAWAAGFFDGKGTIFSEHGRLRLTVRVVDEEAVRRFAEIVGVGKVYGPYANTQADGWKRRPSAMWVAVGSSAEHLLEKFWPWLTPRRREQAQRFHVFYG